MNSDQKQGSQNDTIMCKNCNLAYGNPVNDYLCIKCFQTTKQSAITITQDPQPNISQNQEQKIENKVLYFKEENYEIQEVKQNDTSRCWQCRKKVNQIGIECKCKFVFCSKHRMPQDHKCTFDHALRGKKCWQCKKKVYLMGIECKCKFVFCTKHRMPEYHECAFDHAQIGKYRLRKELVSCVASKIQRI